MERSTNWVKRQGGVWVAEGTIISRIYGGHEAKGKVQYVKCTERNPGLVSQKAYKRMTWLWFCWLSGKNGYLQQNTLGYKP